jgi:signal transduction histidine kinase
MEQPPQTEEIKPKAEYRVRFDNEGSLLGASLHSSLGERLGIAVDPSRESTISEYVERLASLDRDLPRRLTHRLRRLIDEHREFSIHDDYTRGHEDHHLHISGRVVRDFDGKLTFILLFLDDTWLTNLRRAYEYMFRLANHELKSPLTCILGAAEYAGNYVASGSVDGVRTSLEMIQRNALVMDEMITRYLNLSRIESGNIRLTPSEFMFSADVLNPLTSELQPALMARQMSVDLVCSGCDHEPPLLADRESLTIVVRNLLSNAIKYGTPETRIVVELARGDEDVEVSVENDGPNIPEYQLKRLFHKFVRLEATQGSKGAGLGLYNARKLVELWGGAIRVTSHGSKTRFSFTVPEQ